VSCGSESSRRVDCEVLAACDRNDLVIPFPSKVHSRSWSDAGRARMLRSHVTNRYTWSQVETSDGLMAGSAFTIPICPVKGGRFLSRMDTSTGELSLWLAGGLARSPLACQSDENRRTFPKLGRSAARIVFVDRLHVPFFHSSDSIKTEPSLRVRDSISHGPSRPTHTAARVRSRLGFEDRSRNNAVRFSRGLRSPSPHC